MPIGSAIALFFIVWWLMLFIILPIGVRNPDEAGEALPEGSDPGAPVKPMMWRKVLITTAVSVPVTGLALFLWDFVN